MTRATELNQKTWQLFKAFNDAFPRGGKTDDDPRLKYIREAVSAIIACEVDLFRHFAENPEHICEDFIDYEVQHVLPAKQNFYKEFQNFIETFAYSDNILKNKYLSLMNQVLNVIREVKEGTMFHNVPDRTKDILLGLENQLTTQIFSDQYEILVLKGGGIKGIAYLGALEALQGHYDFNWFAGSSAGAITATLLAAGYSPSELKGVMMDKNFADFKDSKYLKSMHNLVTKGGRYEAKTFTTWIEDLVKTKIERPGRVTMNDLTVNTKNRLSVFASKREANALMFDSKSPDQGDVSIASATRASMAIPFYFTPMTSMGLNYYDGGVRNNYPMDLVLSHLAKENPVVPPKYLGLYLQDGDKPEPPNSGFGSTMSDLFSIWQEASDKQNLDKYFEHTVVINTSPIEVIDFNLTNEEKEFLIECGKLSARQFLKKRGLEPNPLELRERLANHEKHRSLISKRRRKLKIRSRIGHSLRIVALFPVVILPLLIYCGIKWWKWVSAKKNKSR